MNALQAATSLYCIGYSLPETDLGIRFLLHYSRSREDIPLYVVNTEPEHAQHYKNLLGKAFYINEKYVGRDAIKRLVDQLTS